MCPSPATLDQKPEGVVTFGSTSCKPNNITIIKECISKENEDPSMKIISNGRIQDPELIPYFKRNNPFTCGTDKWQFHYAKRHSDALTNFNETNKYLVYQCRKGSCAGWGDRIIGIITTFYFTLISDRIFLIDHTNPTDLENSLTFNAIDWRFSRQKQKLERLSSKYSDVYFCVVDKPLRKQFEFEDFRSLLSTDVEFVLFNERVYTYMHDNPKLSERRKELGLDRMSFFDIFGCLFQFLFKPNQSMKDLIQPIYWNNFKTHPTQKVIGVQIRTGEGVGEPPRLLDTTKSAFWSCIDQVSARIKQAAPNNTEPKIFLTTDSNAIKEYARHRYKDRLITFNTEIAHVDYSASKGVFQSTLAEFMMLAMCDEFIISRSNFGEAASMLNFNSRYKIPGAKCDVDPPEFELASGHIIIKSFKAH
ncbi:hypothetical protein FDP41_004835 [Naegleria fowleri]|uniref:GT23 domain-containing protein n=1 Tax=Naegleria fowleri TaxID=5763 RepID=A0A6A5BQN3_NAEFO|nr:uncharacterized protein FDP41_004835 [Naegleria fowleri]KAF0976160.1 hypothetical protein FDP41_004835 [Naegleria fowleri]